MATTTLTDGFTGILTNLQKNADGSLELEQGASPLITNESSTTTKISTSGSIALARFQSSLLHVTNDLTLVGFEQYTDKASGIRIYDCGTTHPAGSLNAIYQCVFNQSIASTTGEGWHGMPSGLNFSLLAGHYYLVGVTYTSDSSSQWRGTSSELLDINSGDATWGDGLYTFDEASVTVGSNHSPNYSYNGVIQLKARFHTQEPTNSYPSSGNHVSQPITIPYNTIESSSISWAATTPTGSSVTVDVSVDGGTTFSPATNNGTIPGLVDGVTSIVLKETLSQTSGATPVLQSVTMNVTEGAVITTSTETVTEVYPYTTQYQDTAELKVGESRTIQTGVDGEYTVTYEITYTDGVETNRTETSRTVSLQPVTEIIEQGTYEPVITVEYVMGEEYPYPPDAPTRTANPDMYEGEERYIVEPVDGIAQDRYKVTYEDGVEVSRVYDNFTSIIKEPIQGQVEYGTKAWPASMEVTAPVPVRNGNTVTIPDVMGVEYVDMTQGTTAPIAEEPVQEASMAMMATATSGEKVLAPGDYTISSTAVIIPRAAASDKTEFLLTNPYATWPYDKYNSIIPEAPQEFQRYIVIPDVEGIEYFDGMTGEVYPAGTERKIGKELTINTRLIVDNAFLTNPDATWTYTRTGGVTALNIERLSDWSFKIPQHSQIEYINKDTGEVLVHNNIETPSSPAGTYYDLNAPGAMPPTGVLHIVPRAIEPAFLNNPYAEWTSGDFNNGLEILSEVLKLDGYTNVDVAKDFAEYVEIYINGELLTDHESPHVYGEVTMELKINKNTGANRQALDWKRGSQGEPTGVYWTNFTGTAPVFEWTGDDTLKTTFTWATDNKFARLYIPVREIDAKTYGKYTMKVSPLVGFNAQADLQLDPILRAINITPEEYGNYFELLINGVKQDATKFTNVSKDDGTAELDLKPGYKEFRLRLTNPDFIWEDFMAARRTSLWINGPKGFVVNFEADVDGDLVWSGTWPEGAQTGTLLIFPFMPQVAVFQTLPKQGLYYDEVNKIVDIPSHSVIEYYDRDTFEVIPPGPYKITRYTEIADRVKWSRRIEKVNGQYYIYEIQDDHRFWVFFFTIADGLTYVTALPPTQVGTIVTIPNVNGVLYWDGIAREYVSGDIDLNTRQYKTMRIKPIAKYASYRLTNPNDVWEHSANFDVYSQRPTQVDNDITIPEVKGVEYINKTTGAVLTGTFRITEDIVITARATGQYILKSLVNEWTFKWVFIEAKYVTAVEPTTNKNWVTIPTVEGIKYVNTATGSTIQGTIYVKDPITVGVEVISERYKLTNPGIIWDYAPVDTGQKEIILMDRDPRLVIHVNGIEVAGDVFAVDAGTPTRLVLSLLEDSEFSVDPYLLAADGTYTYFTRVGENRGASLEITFADNTPIELHIGTVTQLTKPLYFTGENTYLEIRQSGAYIATLYPGETGRLFIDNNYDFTIVPEYDHEFDRPGSYTHDTVTTVIEPATGMNASFSIAFIQGPLFISMSAVQLTKAVSPHERGFNNVYITEYETLNLVSKEMLRRRRDFVINNPDGGMNYEAHVATNPHDYIINTIMLPFSVPFEYVANRERITLGYQELFPSALRLREDKIPLDLGQIYTTPKYGNSYDFANTTVNLHLPYTQPITIDPAYVIGQTISLEYIVDVYTGIATVNVRSSLVLDNIFYSLEVKIGNEVPFISMKDGSVIGGAQQVQARLNNNTPQPFIEVIRNVPYEKDSPFNNLTRTSVGGLSGLEGHITVHDIKLNMTKATLDEENQLRSVLASGIVIK